MVFETEKSIILRELAIFAIEFINASLICVQVEKHDGYFYAHSDTSFKINSDYFSFQ